MLKLKNKIFSYLVVLILVLLSAGLIPPLRAPLINIIKFPLKILNSLGREIGGIIFYHRNLVDRDRLNIQVELLNQKLNEFNELSLENDRLRKLLSFKKETPYRVIAAQVIAHSPDNWSSMMIIDKGTADGIKHGMVVIGYLGLVGRIVESGKNSSKVMLVTDSNFGVSAIVQRSRQEGLVCGGLGNTLIMKYLPRDSDIEVSDIVITSGLTENYPKGILIGTVTEVGEEFSGLSDYAVVRPAMNSSSLEEVLIIVK